VEERLGCAFMTADKLLKQFAELKKVKETTGGQRNRHFEYSPNPPPARTRVAARFKFPHCRTDRLIMSRNDPFICASQCQD
jgi:hypothetical protein